MAAMSGTAAAAAVVTLGYCLGMLPTAMLVARRTGRDPTVEGSGNPGATNTTRISGRGAGFVVLLGDVAKGAVAAGVGLAVGGRALGLAAGAAAVVGHIFPVTRSFRGGKGVATASGMAAVLYPLVSVVLVVVLGVVYRVTGKMSVASLTIAVLLPIGVALRGRPGWEVAGVAALSLLVFVRHRENIRRLLGGSEFGVASE